MMHHGQTNSTSLIRLIFTASLGLSLICVQLSQLYQHKHRIEARIQATTTATTTPITTSILLIQQQQQDQLACLTHEHTSLIIDNITNETTTTKAQKKHQGSDPSKHILEHQAAVICGQLRRNWLHNPPLSKYAKKIEAHQSNCSSTTIGNITLGTTATATHHFDNTFGLGSHLILWGQAMCNGMELGLLMRSQAPEWLWLDRGHCDMQTQAAVSPLLCYFPSSEDRCGSYLKQQQQHQQHQQKQEFNITDPRRKNEWCQLAKQSEESKAMVRASSTEYLFQSLSPLVIQEAKRQIGVVFPGGEAPEDLVTVHIRWGDKFWEMDLPPIQEYIDAVHAILSAHDDFPGHVSNMNVNASVNENANVNAYATTTTTANIYLSTEDPRAYQEFMDAKPDGWKVYADITLLEIDAFRPLKGNHASWTARNTKGRSGLVALGSLLVAMEANMFVLTTKSNWSTLMNHLRTNVIDPRCGNCTSMVDLRPGIW